MRLLPIHRCAGFSGGGARLFWLMWWAGVVMAATQHPVLAQGVPALSVASAPRVEGEGSRVNGPAAEAAERSRIAQERSAVHQRFEDRSKRSEDESRACYQRFAVNDCLEQARSLRREQLGDLRRQEISLNDADRRRKAADAIRRAESRSNPP